MSKGHKTIRVDNIVNNYDHTDGGWCWTKYGVCPYMGCSYDCAYCYNLGYSADNQVQVKNNAVSMLQKELKTLPKDVVTIGDYQPAETELRLIREMLKVIQDAGFPLHIIEKSPLVTEDLDLISQIGKKSWAAVSISVTAAPSLPDLDKALLKYEPETSTAAERFAAMAKIASAGILTGTSCVPLIPYIGDAMLNIEELIKATKEAGGKYFLIGALVVPQPFDDDFWDITEEHFPDQAVKLQRLYDPENTEKFNEYFGNLDRKTTKLCAKYGILDHIPRPVDFYSGKIRMNKILAEQFYLKSRFSKSNRQPQEMELTYLALAWLLDDLPGDISAEYQKKGDEALAAYGLEDDMIKELAAVINEELSAGK